MKIYLGGGIHGMAFDTANGWRGKATRELGLAGHEAINPLRHRLWKDASEQGQFNSNELVHRDLRDVQRADALLVEYSNENRNYTGTDTEMALARYLWHKPVIVVVGERKTWSPWLNHLATKIVTDLEEAIEYICILDD